MRAAAAEQRAMIAEMRAQLAEAKANERIQEAERRARSAEDSRAWAEQRAQNVAQQLREAERRVQEGLQREEQVLAQVNLVENQRRTAEQRRQEAEQRCQNVAQQLREAERRVQEGLQREEQVLAQVNLVENQRRTAEQRRQEAEQRCQNVAQQLREAERRVQEGLQREELAQVNLVENQRRTDTSEQRHQEAEQRCQEAELELREVKNHWTVQREDIEISDRELGRGGWGVVKIATFCGICVAAKCFYRELSSSYYRYLFEREMNMAARLRHPNLVQFIGATLEGEPIILMELMSKSLRALLESGPISLHQTTSICIDVGLVLNYLHKMKPQPVIHRDLSSANILLNPLPGSQWRAKISDYGSVNVLQQLRTVGPGSPVYAAPEAKDPHLQSPKMDIFSFGVLMIEMLTDQFPEVRIRRRLIGSIRHAGYVALIQRCMDEDREWRPSAEEVLSQLKDFEH